MQAVLEALRARRDEMTSLTRSWVEVNSFTANVAGVNRVGELLDEGFDLRALKRKIWKSSRFGDHHLWLTDAADRPGAGTILLIGHHDTVFPPGVFEGWREADGRAVGPGTLDMKGGLAVIRAALAALDDVGALAAMPLAAVSVADEEVGSSDSAPHLTELATRTGAVAALVFESGREADQIVTRRKGTGAVKVIAQGRAAHAGNAHAEGRNAIWALARFVDHAQRLTAYEQGVTVNLGVISGATTKNTVPAGAQCDVDLRFETAAHRGALLADLEAAARRAEAEVQGTTLSIERGSLRPPLERTEASGRLCAEYLACQKAAGLGGEESPLVGGGSDANTVAAVGVPAIDGLGPRGRGFHTTSEYVELASFAPKAEALVRFLWGRFGG